MRTLANPTPAWKVHDMSETPIEGIDGGSEVTDADRRTVEQERAELTEFVKGLNPVDIKSGAWFAKLLAQSLATYTEKATWDYFQEKYRGVPADAIVDQRIKMAARYASIEGALSAGAYSAAIIATLGTLGGSGPATVPGAIVTFVVDVAYLSRLQLRLAYDIAVLYRLPIDMSDPDDLWKLIRVAFTIKGGEVVGEGVMKAVPVAIRAIIKKYVSGTVLTAAKGLPFVGKYLLQRTIIKVAIPVVSVPIAAAINFWTTVVAGRHARAVFRNEARVIEAAAGLSKRSRHPQLMLWVAWLVIMADQKISDDETLLIRHLMKMARDHHQVVDEQLANLIDVEPAEVWERIEAEAGDLSDILDVANRVALVDGAVNARESALIAELQERCARV
jgi:hypothetical protein